MYLSFIKGQQEKADKKTKQEKAKYVSSTTPFKYDFYWIILWYIILVNIFVTKLFRPQWVSIYL